MFNMDTTFLSCHLCQFTPLHARVKIISHTCLQFSSAESNYLDQRVHMHMLINAFAIPSAFTILLSGRLLSDDIQTRLDV